MFLLLHAVGHEERKYIWSLPTTNSDYDSEKMAWNGDAIVTDKSRRCRSTSGSSYLTIMSPSECWPCDDDQLLAAVTKLAHVLL